MPVYEYECNTCRCKFDRRQRFDEEPSASCPQCTGKAQRVIHSVPVLFKGSGFYCTDHGRGSSGNSKRTDEESDTKPASKAEAKTEDKVKDKSEVKVKESG